MNDFLKKIIETQELILLTIQEKENYLANPNESLYQHIINVLANYDQRKQNRLNIYTKIFKNLNNEDYEIIDSLFRLFVMSHDLGKINPYFQAKFNKEFGSATFSSRKGSAHSKKSLVFLIKGIDSNNTKLFNESILGSLIQYLNSVDSDKKILYIYLIKMFSFIIIEHHTDIRAHIDENKHFSQELEDFEDFKVVVNYFQKMNKLIDRHDNRFFKFLKKEHFITYFYRFMYSELTLSDFLSVIEINKKELNFKDIENNVNKFLKKAPKTEINRLRSLLYLEAEKTLTQNIGEKIFYLEMPTGAGKTLTSLRLASKLAKEKGLKKIVYAFPYNTIIEQTQQVFTDIYQESFFDIFNSEETSSSASKDNTHSFEQLSTANCFCFICPRNF